MQIKKDREEAIRLTFLSTHHSIEIELEACVYFEKTGSFVFL